LPVAKESPGAIEIKGYGNDVNIILSTEAHFPDVEAELIKRLEDSHKFFSGVPIVLDAGERVLAPEECKRLKEILIDRFKLNISSIRSESDETRKAMREIGWETKPRQRRQRKKSFTLRMPAEEENDTILLKGTLRSGQRKWHRGNIVIIGDVNPGAEVVATGDIVILGKLRGVAHAGAEGDTAAEIIALDLHPIQLRIAEYIGRSPDLDLKTDRAPEKARVEDGNIVVCKLN